MKNFKHLFVIVASMFIVSCGILPFKSEIKENHFRFENFKKEVGNPAESINLMCFRKRPTSWTEPKQYLSGEHLLWVEADIYNQSSSIGSKTAFALFKVKLDSGKSYMLNRKIEGEKISIWIQESETGLRVSGVVTTDLKIVANDNNYLRVKRCKTSTI
jgi:hypothetical protein